MKNNMQTPDNIGYRQLPGVDELLQASPDLVACWGHRQARRDGAAAKRFFKRVLWNHGGEPRKIVTDKLRSYGVARGELISETIHVTDRYANNRAEQSGRHSGSWVLMQRLVIYSTLAGIWYLPTIIEISGSVRLQNGEGQLLVSTGEYVAGIRISRKRRVYTVEYGLIRGCLRADRI